ncbi:MAG: DNA primase [Gammaproteobacteria bacterium]|nr:DNA primase [Gammaproteobacteria bacterium]
MAGRIPQDFIDDLVARADIVEVVGARVPLKKAGREYKACCPFHGEKTPSFTVSPEKGFYHCFGCGAHGTAIGFLMEFDRLEFVDAVEELAHMLGVEVPREESASGPRSPVAPVYDTLAEATRLYQQSLKDAATAVDYLRSRGLDGETAREFGIGYAPAAWDFLLRRLGDTPERERLLQSAGLIVPRDGGGHYDRFRDRIIFPIRDSRGRVVAFGGRVLGTGEPKYLNSPETAVFHKGRELYGLYEARRASRRLERVLVVEGYMDVVSLARHGIRNVVATLGTATTAEQLRRLFRATPEVVFCFDGDRAGRDAAWRALQNALPEMREGHQVRFLFLPEGEDPDSLVRQHGAAELTGRLRDAVALSDYLLDHLRSQADLGSMEGRARLAELAKPLLNAVPQGVYRELLTQRLAEEVGLSPQKMAGLVGPAERPAKPATRTRIVSRPARSGLVRRAIQLLLNYPMLGDAAPIAGLENAHQKGSDLLRELLEMTAQRPNVSSAALLERFRERREGPHLEALLAEEMLVDEAAAARELADCLARIVASEEEARLEALVAKAAVQELTSQEREELRGLRRSASGPDGAGNSPAG